MRRGADDAAHEPISTIRPAYITAMRSATSTATPMSWVTKMIDKPEFALQLAQEQEDLDLHRGVERRRRLVGEQHASAGRPAPARSSPAGACRPTSRADRRRAAARARGCARARTARAPARAPRRRRRSRGRTDRLDDLLAERVDRVEARASAPGRSSRRRRREIARARVRASRAHRAPSTAIAPVDARPRFGMQPQQRAQRDALARAGFAEQRQDLALPRAARSTAVDGATRAARRVPKVTVRSLDVDDRVDHRRAIRRLLKRAPARMAGAGLRHEAGRAMSCRRTS